MPVPKKRKSPMRRDRRRAQHDRVAMPPLTYCTNPECGAPVRPHHVCPECGQYKGEEVIEVVTEEQIEARKKERRDRAKAAAAGARAEAEMRRRGGKGKEEDEEEDEEEEK